MAAPHRVYFCLLTLAAVFLKCSSAGVIDTRQLFGASLLWERQTTNGFQLAETGKFAGLGLTSTCESVLYQTIDCDAYVTKLGAKVYHGSLGDTALTDAVCATTCSTALATARRRISSACSSSPELFPGYPVLALIDSITTGWNETCLKSSDGSYCNDVIESWPTVDDISNMPKEQLCSFCLGAKLRMMQQSSYSAYDALDAERLLYINQNCDVTSPTDPLPGTINPNGTVPESCVTGSTYTAKSGDTCDSVALANSVSAATLFYINPDATNCNNLTADLNLCLPQKCETTYTVKEGDSCVAVGVDQGTTWMNIVAWNSGLDSRCTNLWSQADSSSYWGRVICVSAPGGIGSGGSGSGNGTGNGNTGGPGGSGDGYADVLVDPPEGTVAEGTTQKCGEYIQAQEGLGCSSIVSANAVPMDLFLSANPSLKTAVECSANLQVGTWYCLHPLRYFDEMEDE